MSKLSEPAFAIAVAAAAVAVVALLLGVGLLIALRRLRAAQRAVLGPEGSRDLVAHAAALQGDFRALNDFVSETATTTQDRMDTVERRLDGTIAYRALVRYDAYGEMSGRQSTTVALLDATRSGIVLSSIHHRESARLYAKQVRAGRGEIELSPEELEAVRAALEGDAVAAAE